MRYLSFGEDCSVWNYGIPLLHFPGTGNPIVSVYRVGRRSGYFALPLRTSFVEVMRPGGVGHKWGIFEVATGVL
jgi:hypothetical protein